MGVQGAGPPGGADTMFLESVARAAGHWMGLLSDPAGFPIIATEAAELARVAIARGTTDVGNLLAGVQGLAVARSGDLPTALGQLTAWLSSRTSAAAPLDRTVLLKERSPASPRGVPQSPEAWPVPRREADPGSVPLPPMLDQTSSRAPGRAEDVPLPPVLDNAPRRGAPSSSPPPAGSRRPALPDPAAPPPAPQLVVKDMLGLRAFKRAAPSAPQPAPGMPIAAPAPSAPPPPADGGVLALGTRRRPPPQPVAAPSPRNDAAEDTQRRQAVQRASARQRVRGARAPSVPAWAYVAGVALAVLALATLAAVLLAGRKPPALSPSGGSAAVGTTSAVAGATSVRPASAGSGGRPPLDVAELAETAHEQGPETPELRALIDAETRIAASCRDDPSRCSRGWAKRSREVLESPDAGSIASSAPPTQGPPSSWLLRLKVPAECAVRDEPSLRGVFDYESKNISGRQQFQQKVFECAAYADIFESTFIKYGAPTWLTAVVFQESGCDPRASSPVGARGLWQFMPDAGRAYGLRVVEDDVDERLNPVKSTEAGVHFLTDLKRKLGSWDLALAAYNMGPFGVSTRIAQVGGRASFWDLARAGLLPDETSAYVPAIEAHALILANLGRLQFSSDGKHLESTAEIVVKPGTRLSLIARAAATSTLRIRQLNPEFLRDVVPDGEASARVPDAEAHRAQTFLEQRAPDDDRDLCVPEDFDWGTKPFETSKYAAACAHGQPAPH